ncbi:hypothetical protein SJDPG12_08960 [Porphyromonas gingivalis SJD12]|uniref:AAA family ATPase n=1 Tax=Porphyromonas gingivalis TaxID=837 RepID=UPI000B512A84|nr:AAA family ATPase [Porphyromonas gingivalis]MCE8179503.1 AAA family ATPase [Porphyromonas gingivalis]OWR81452.1 hypothetical protein SJDPG12_08960 [Porphyromonas gingivalis SJD12]
MERNIHEEQFLKQSSLLDKATHYEGKLLQLAQEIVSNSPDEKALLFCKSLSSFNTIQENQVTELVKATKLSLIQLYGYRSLMEACQRATTYQVELNANETLQDCLSELNQLIGLQQVKQSVEDLVCYQQIQKQRATIGLSTPQRTLHLAFTGNPGTGKTTVARIVGRMYRHLGLLSQGHFIEASRTDLIASYQGQTAHKVKKLIERAKGGVLFIDEAYSITENEHSDSYGRECLTELTKALEDYRQDLVVIVAGYTDPMKQFFSSNPGLSSRFNTFIEFPDYDETELLSIFNQMCVQDDYELSQAGFTSLADLIRSALNEQQSQFSNARFVRNLYERAVIQHARRVSSIIAPTIEDLRMLCAIDLQCLSR